MALVLRVGGVGDFFGEGVVGMLEASHDRCVNADVEGFEAIEILGGIEKAIDGVGVGALRFGQAEDGAERFGYDASSVRGVVDKFGGFSGELGIKFASKCVPIGLEFCLGREFG